jgi:hypothetical protein
MAMFMKIGGNCGAFIVTPLSGAVGLTCVLGVQVWSWRPARFARC